MDDWGNCPRISPMLMTFPQGSQSSCDSEENFISVNQVLVSPIEGLSPSHPGTGGPGSTTSGSGMSPCYSNNNNNVTSSAGCCENGRPLVTDPVTGQPVCSCPYDSAARLAALTTCAYPRLTSTAGVYGTPYPSTDQNPYPSIDSSPFYPSLGNPYGLKDSAGGPDMTAWTSAGLQTTSGYYHYDPAMAAYGYGSSYDLAARRKNATRESTATLKAWLSEHKKNPYPTKGEKIMLAIITKMTLTQVSTWFANARRRLKKENKMTWEPKNKTDDDDDTVISDSDEKDKDDLSVDGDNGMIKRNRITKDGMLHVKTEHGLKDLDDDDDLDDEDDEETKPSIDILQHHHMHQHHSQHHHMLSQSQHINNRQHPHSMIQQQMNKSQHPSNHDCGIPLPATKPKIWSLADTAACKTPPPLHMQQQQSWCNSSSMFNGVNSRNGFISSGVGPYANRYSGYYSSSGNSSGSCPSSGSSSNFPDVQTDTPPQTPPNMKLPSVAGNLMNGPVSTNSPANFNSNTNTHISPSSNGYVQPSQGHHQQYVNNNCFNNNSQMSLHPHSPQKDIKTQKLVGNNPLHSPGTYHHHHHHQQNQQQQRQSSPYLLNHSMNQTNADDETAFKPFYKNNVAPEQMNGPFAAAV